jgi:GntR family transcriptional regulator
MTTKIVPMYHQIYLTLKNDIDRGKYRSDRPFPNEIVLAKRFGVSRVTLRRTLEMLQREGLIVRRPGVGTFPAPPDPRVKFRSSIDSFFDTLKSSRDRYVTTAIDSQVAPTPPFLLEQYPDFGETCLQIKRVSKTKDGRPIHFGTHYVPDRLLKNLKAKTRSSATLLLQLNKAGVSAVRTDLVIGAALADLEAARYLEVQAGSPLIVTKRFSLNGAGEPIEFMYAVTRPDHYEYVFRFTENDSHNHAF